jgi:hypothetical protein
MHDFTGFHDLLESPQVTLHLLVWLFTEELRYPCSQPASRRLIPELDHDLSATATGRIAELH